VATKEENQKKIYFTIQSQFVTIVIIPSNKELNPFGRNQITMIKTSVN